MQQTEEREAGGGEALRHHTQMRERTGTPPLPRSTHSRKRALIQRVVIETTTPQRGAKRNYGHVRASVHAMLLWLMS